MVPDEAPPCLLKNHVLWLTRKALCSNERQNQASSGESGSGDTMENRSGCQLVGLLTRRRVGRAASCGWSYSTQRLATRLPHSGTAQGSEPSDGHQWNNARYSPSSSIFCTGRSGDLDDWLLDVPGLQDTLEEG